MQIQADISGRDVHRALDGDLSALGTAHLAGRVAGIWTDAQLDTLPRHRDEFHPGSSEPDRARSRSAWRAAVRRSRGLPVDTHHQIGREDATDPDPDHDPDHDRDDGRDDGRTDMASPG